MSEPDCAIAMVGLAVMGQNLVLNMSDHGYKIAVFTRTTAEVDKFAPGQAKGAAVSSSTQFSA